MAKTLLITTLIVSMVCFLSCKEDADDPIAATPPDDVIRLTKDDSVKANAHLVRDAAEAFAAANGGVYARDVHESLPDGRNLIDFLPDGQMLLNPYTYLKDSPEPHLGWEPGDVGYTYFRGVSPFGYQINGVGADYENIIVLLLDPLDP